LVAKIAATVCTILLCGLVARADEPATQQAPPPEAFVFGIDSPENQCVDINKLIALTQWVKSNNDPILSILISRNGKVVYQLYTSSIDPEAAHYLMSATKSFTSALAGAAIDRKLLPPTSTPINQMLPRDWFPSDTAFNAFDTVTLKDVLGMSALDAPVYPHQMTPEAKKRDRDYFEAPNRTKFALTQKVFAHPGKDFLYTDVTCALAAGAVQWATKQSLFDFANTALFGPMGFENQEWMHQDYAAIDNGAYGLRLRPIDMQKFGVLFLNKGNWNGQQLLSRAWVDESFHPWIPSEPEYAKYPDYGSYWWKFYCAPGGWTGNSAIGWKGQYIAVFPKWDTVVTMTSIFEDGSENSVFRQIIGNYVAPAIVKRSLYVKPDDTTLATEKQQLADLLDQVHSAPSRIRPGTETRMIPSIDRKESHDRFWRP
jgi:CubicO group peptidase (beta-lactamase class C family)